MIRLYYAEISASFLAQLDLPSVAPSTATLLTIVESTESFIGGIHIGGS
jgi:hypothetical protein